MMSDSKGYLWLATDKGLVKYNSRNFQILSFTSTQLKSVAYINEDTKGKIWCINFYKQIFYVERDSLKHFDITSEEYFQQPNILNFSVDETNIYLTTLSSILIIDKKSHKIVKKISPTSSKNAVFQHSILYNNELYFFDRKNQLLNLSNPRQPHSPSANFLEIRLAVCNNKLIAIERGKRKRQAILFDGNTIKSLPNYNVPQNAYVYHLSVTGEKEIWICTQNGAYLWNYETGKTKPFFINERVSDVVKDFQGNYWFSTLDNGLYKCPNLNCIKISSPFNNNDNATKIIKTHNGHFVVGNTKGEIAEIDKNARCIKKYKSATNEEIEFLHISKDGKKLYSDGGLFDYKTGKIITPYEFGKMVDEDNLGNIIISTFNRGMATVNDFIKVDTTKLPNNILFNKFDVCNISIAGKILRKARLLRIKRSTYCLADISNQGFWVAYDDDLYFYNNNGTTSIIKDKNRRSILATHLLQIGNKLYVSTTTNGLYVLNEQNNEEKHYTTDNGLQSNIAKKTIVEKNKIWLLTDESLEMIDISSGLTQDFLSTSGLESLTVYDFAIDSDLVFLATPNGIMRYVRSENPIGDRIKITELSVINNSKEIPQNSNIDYNKNSIIIKLDAIHYKSPNRLQFHYRLLGSDSTLQTVAATNNIINYKSLAPGNYCFEVYAADVNMIFRSTTSTFSFSVTKPYWQKVWFWCLVFIVSAGMILLGVKVWARKFKLKQQAQENLLQSKLTAIRSQMNPHFLYNVLNTVQGLVYANKKNEASEMLGNFSDLMRKTLQESDKTEILLKDEIESLQLYLALEKKRFDASFFYQIIVGNDIETEEIYIPSMFIQPFAENAIKHGLLHKEGDKTLYIIIKKEKNKLLISIDDNGVGRNRAANINKKNKILSTGFAIKGVNDRISIYNEMNVEKISFEIIDKTQGTLVNLHLPIK